MTAWSNASSPLSTVPKLLNPNPRSDFTPNSNSRKSKMESASIEREKSILVRGIREIKFAGGEEVDFEAWFLIQRTNNGLMEASEVFQTATKRLPKDLFYWQASCAQIGSFLYVLGGRNPMMGYMHIFSDSVRRIDIKNPLGVWKACKPLPYPAGLTRYGAAGNLVYIFPSPRSHQDNPVGFIYDVSDQKGYDIVPPPCFECNQSWNLANCVAYELRDGNRGVLTQLRRSNKLEKYYPDKKLWEPLVNIQLPAPLSSLPPQQAVLNGILYLSLCDWYESGPVVTVLHAYDIGTGRPLLGNGEGITLPKFEKLKDVDRASSRMSLVAVSDYKLCYLWYEQARLYNHLKVIIATVVVSPDHSGASVSEEEFVLNARFIENIIPLLVP